MENVYMTIQLAFNYESDSYCLMANGIQVGSMNQTFQGVKSLGRAIVIGTMGRDNVEFIFNGRWDDYYSDSIMSELNQLDSFVAANS